MTITFNNQVYATGYVGEDDGGPTSATNLDNVSQNPITVNGTINNVGDTVTVTGLLPGSSASGDTATTNTLYVVSFDNPNMIEFSSNPPGSQTSAANAFRYFLSNTALTQGQRVTLNNDPTLSQYQPVCFATGTAILTTRGEVLVEELRVGDRAITASGGQRPITWIGHRDLDASGRTLAHDQQPICIRQGAFGADVEEMPIPSRTLRLSPGHPVLVGADEGEAGVLVPIMCLINGTSIKREAAGSVTYWHVELDSHDILVADGLAVESYFDLGSRAWFDGSDAPLHDADLVFALEGGRCRPVAIDGPLVDAERQRLDTLFAISLADPCAWPLQGPDTMAI